MPLAESNYPFFELAFDKFETLGKKWQRRTSTGFLWLLPLPSAGTTSITEWGAAWIFKRRVQGDCKRCHDQEVAPTSHSFTRAPVTYVSWQDTWVLEAASSEPCPSKASPALLGPWQHKTGTAALTAHLQYVQYAPQLKVECSRGFLAACPS